MADGLKIKKIYVDSKFRTVSSRSTSNFKIELNQTLTMPQDTVFYISEVSIPYVWKTIQAGVNDQIFIKYQVVEVPPSPVAYLSFTMPAGNYTGQSFYQALDALLIAAPSGNPFKPLVYDSINETLEFTTVNIDAFAYVMTDYELLHHVFDPLAVYGPDFLANAPSHPTINGFLNNSGIHSEIITFIANWTAHISLHPVRNIYIHSPNLAGFNTIGCNGEGTVIKKVIVNANSNEQITSTALVSNDFLDCSGLTLRTLEFRLTDANGKDLTLHGHHVSFSIVFDQLDPKQ